ncbi:MAG: dihydrolipoyl dehydrogenase [Thermoplasmataceae archaeon]|jgi:dihydrolipoamide dehydrogenase
MEYNTIIIGAGPAGYAAAIRLGQKGRKVLMVEKEKIGGECLNYGCIPSKALIELAHSIGYLKEMPGVSIRYDIDLEAWQKWKWNMINKLTSGVEVLCKSFGIEIIRGVASIVDSNKVRVDSHEYSGENLIIATGSVPSRIPSFGDVWYNREILDFKKVPERLVIIGGGYIGIEMGNAFAKLGSKVTIIEMMETILPGVERELVNPVERSLRAMNVEIRTGSKVTSVIKDSMYHVKIESGESFDAENVLLTVGRKPNTEGFGLENLKLEMNGRFIKTDLHKRTSIPNVYAIGDVSGEPMLAHKAYYDAEVATDNILGEEREVDYRAMPFVIYSDPEISYTGSKGDKVSIFPLAANGRSLSMNANVGTYRIYSDKNGTVTGAGIVAPHSSEMISEISVAVESGLNAMDIGMTIHPHPTVSEGVKEAAEGVYGFPLHFKPSR